MSILITDTGLYYASSCSNVIDLYFLLLPTVLVAQDMRRSRSRTPGRRGPPSVYTDRKRLRVGVREESNGANALETAFTW